MNALWRGSRLLILDEPTSMLTPQGFAELEKVITRLKATGPRRRLHHAQAARGARARRPRLDPASGPRRRHARPRAACARRRTTCCATEIIQIMFGEEAREVADVAELQDRAGRARPRAGDDAVRGDVVLELEGVSAAGHRLRARDRRRLAPGAPGRGARHRRRRRQRPARARRGRSPGQRPTSTGDVRLFGASINRLNVAAAPEARPALRHRRPPRRGDRRARWASTSTSS